MAKENETQIGTRHLIKRGGNNFYFFISDTDIMFSAAGEGDIRNQDEYSSVNAICRLISVARSSGIEWPRIIKQLDGANVTGNRTWARDIAGIVRSEFNID